MEAYAERDVDVRRALFAFVASAVFGACGGSSAIHFTNEGIGLELTSTAFRNETRIPTKHTCDGSGVSPPLQITWIPEGTVTLALVVEDPDAPRGTWDHWVAYDIPPTAAIPEGVGALGTSGVSSGGSSGYESPCPPSGTHRYFFTVYALDTRLGMAPGADKVALLSRIDGHVLATATLLGRYSR